MEKRLLESGTLLDSIRKKNSLIHCITHGINLNDMANVILALNQSPIMADHPEETALITSKASALLINLGNFQEHRRLSIMRSLESAESGDIPVILDLVGIGASPLRLELALEILKSDRISIIKGNYSEIVTLYDRTNKTRGVDNEEKDVSKVTEAVRNLSRNYSTTVAATGVSDMICTGDTLTEVHNGTPRLTMITGTGCISGAVMASFIPYTDSHTAATLAMTLVGLAGERAAVDYKGAGTYHIRLLDEISMMTGDILRGGARWIERD